MFVRLYDKLYFIILAVGLQPNKMRAELDLLTVLNLKHIFYEYHLVV